MSVSFSNDEKKLLERLTKKNPDAGKIYYSALFVFRQKNPSQTRVSDHDLEIKIIDENSKNMGIDSKKHSQENFDRIAQSAHSIRETLNVALRDPKIIPPEMEQLEHIQKIQKLSNPQDSLPKHLLLPHKQLHALHGWFTSVSHHGHSPSEQKYQTKLEEFTSIMNHLLAPHYEIEKQIDKILKIIEPTEEDLNNLEFMMAKNLQTYHYFFMHAKSNWLEVLYKNGKYFKNVPKVTKEEKLFRTPSWPESYYLERIAAEKPEMVQKIILKIDVPKCKLEKNHTVLDNFVGAAINMPPKYARKIAEKAIKEKWHDVISVLLLEQSLVNLMKSLVEEEFETSLKLCEVLLDVHSKNLEDPYSNKDTYIDPYYYEQILKKELPIFVARDHDSIINMLSKKLSKMIHLDKKASNVPKTDQNMDTSFVWRPAIEDHWQNGDESIKSLLVTEIRKTLEASKDIGISNLKTSLKILAERNYYIFRKLEIYFYGKHPTEFVREINQLCIKYFDNANFTHEYLHMLKSSYPYLQENNKEALLALIDKGPDFDKYRGHEIDFEAYTKRWRIEKLSPIIEYLPEFLNEYDYLVQEYGISNSTEFPVWREPPSYATYSSDLSMDMSIDEVIKFLKSYKMSQRFFLEEDGNGRMFGQIVEKNPVDYSKRSNELLPCHSLFHYRFLEALSKTKDLELDWESVLTFCKSVLQSSLKEENVMYYCCYLLQNNLTSNTNRIPFRLRGKVWNILERSLMITPPDTDWSEDYPGKNFNAYEISVNNNVGMIMHTIECYSSWCDVELKKLGGAPTELVPEVKSILNSLLNTGQPQSVSVHAVLGYSFCNLLALDEKWTRSHINTIFAHDEQNTNVGNAAWDAYLRQTIFPESFSVLFDEYIYRIGRMSENSKFKESQKILAEHIGVAYLNNLDRSDKLLEAFLKKDVPSLLTDCITQIGRGLKDRDDKTKIPQIDISKLTSYPQIKSNPNSGWLFFNSLMDKQERIDLLNSILDETNGEIAPMYWIPEELELFAKDYPLETIKCIEKITHYYIPNNTNMYTMLDHFEKIFQLILETEHELAVEQMRQIVNLLGSLGFNQFKRFS